VEQISRIGMGYVETHFSASRSEHRRAAGSAEEACAARRCSHSFENLAPTVIAQHLPRYRGLRPSKSDLAKSDRQQLPESGGPSCARPQRAG
jgi:hypothetical protein